MEAYHDDRENNHADEKLEEGKAREAYHDDRENNHADEKLEEGKARVVVHGQYFL
jgi:hypothetical protein